MKLHIREILMLRRRRKTTILTGLVIVALVSAAPIFGFKPLAGLQQSDTPATDPFLARFFAAEGDVQANWNAVHQARMLVIDNGWEPSKAGFHLLRPFTDLSWDGADYGGFYAGKYNWWQITKQYSGPSYDRLSYLLGEPGEGPYTISLERFVRNTFCDPVAEQESTGTWRIVANFDANSQAILAGVLESTYSTGSFYIDWFGDHRELTAPPSPAMIVLVANNKAYLPFDAAALISPTGADTQVILATGLDQATAIQLVALIQVG